jgi:hypothetical protein
MDKDEIVNTYQQETDEMLKLLEGKTEFRCDGKIVRGDYLYHILGIFDNEKIAVKFFGKHHQWWHYEFIDAWSLYQDYKRGCVEIK